MAASGFGSESNEAAHRIHPRAMPWAKGDRPVGPSLTRLPRPGCSDVAMSRR
jgi:hypothetical protein